MLRNKSPIAGMLLLLVVGILIFDNVGIQIDQWIFYGGSALFLSIIIATKFIKSQLWLFGLSILLWFALLGYSISSQFDKKSSRGLTFEESETVLLEITDILKSSSKYNKFFAKALIEKDGEMTRCHILLNIKKDNNELKELKIADIILAEAGMYKLKAAPNPVQFDYSQYLARKGVFHQAFVYSYAIIDSNFSIRRTAQDLRTRLLSEFGRTSISKKNLSALQAILLGDKVDLDNSLKSDFAAAGAMHILAVSGLHVGIIYMIFNYFLQLIYRNRFLFLKAMISLSVVWAFALITGLSSSVLRSSIMFSLIILAIPLKRKNTSLNALFFSAVLILLYDPMSLFSASFQLSYSAVLGILLVYPPLFNILQTKNKHLNKLISLLLISFVAQLSTLAFSLHYFHQFPSYFLLSNLLVIPLSFLIVAAGVLCSFALLAFQEALFLDHLLEFLLDLLLTSVEWIADLPNAVIDGIWFTNISIVFIALSVLLFEFYLHSRRSTFLLCSLTSLVLILFLELAERRQKFEDKELTVYSLKQNTLISYRNGLAAVVFPFDSVSSFNLSIAKNHLQSNKVDVHNLKVDSSLTQKEANVKSLEVENFKLLKVDSYRATIDRTADLLIMGPTLEHYQELYNEEITHHLVYSYDELDSTAFFNLYKRAFVKKF